MRRLKEVLLSQVVQATLLQVEVNNTFVEYIITMTIPPGGPGLSGAGDGGHRHERESSPAAATSASQVQELQACHQEEDPSEVK